MAYLGLSFCQYHLGEREIARKTLAELLAYDWRDRKGRAVGAARRALKIPIFAYGTGRGRQQVVRYLASFGTEREAMIRQLKEQARSFLRQEAENASNMS